MTTKVDKDRLNCKLARVLGEGGQPPPTWREVLQLLRMTAAALRRFSDHPTVEAVALNIDLLRLCLRAGGDEARLRTLRGVASRLLHAADVQGTPIGDAMDDALRRPGAHARAGRTLAKLAGQLLEIEWPSVNVAAHNIARALGRAHRHKGIVTGSHAEPLARVLRECGRDIDMDEAALLAAALLAELRENKTRRQQVAIDLVVAAATASGFQAARARLFGKASRKRGRLRLVK